MSRGPNIDRQIIKNNIFNVCQTMVRKKGAGAVSARKIATQVGCSVGTIYNLYKNIDAIILEVNGKTIDSLKNKILEIVGQTEDPLVALHKFGALYISFSQGNYHLWYSLLEYPRKQGVALPDWYQQKVDNIFAIISKTIAQLLDGDSVKADMATRVLWAGFHGISSLAVSGRLDSVKTDSAPVLVYSLIENYISGMRMRTRELRAKG